MQDYHDHAQTRAIPLAVLIDAAQGGQLAPRPIRPAINLKPLVAGVIAFCAVFGVGGFLLGLRWMEGQLTQARQGQEQAEKRLASMESQLREFCTSVLASPPAAPQPSANPATQQPSGAVAANPTP